MVMLRNDSISRYQQRLGSLPPSGGGGCHPALLGCASLGARAGVSPEQICVDLRTHIHGTRHVSDREIADAVNKASMDCHRPSGTTGRERPRWKASRSTQKAKPAFNADAFLAARIEEGKGIGEADIWEASPIRLDTSSEQDASVLLRALYAPDDVLFIGGTYGRTVKTVAEWLNHFGVGMPLPPHLIPNPLTGSVAQTKDGRPSMRADACVKAFRFAVAEFDGMSREDQLCFWWSVDLPVCALIDSGGKSLHAWIRIDGVESVSAWTTLVEEGLFMGYLIPLGCDAACRNEARLSRLPGHFRETKGRWQRLLYLAPEGRAIHACS